MKELKPLKIEELTLEQKIALTICATPIIGDKEIEPLIEMAKKRMLGSVYTSRPEWIKAIQDAADYPIMFVGLPSNPDSKIPQLISITASGSNEEYAYSYGKVVAIESRKLGINANNEMVVDIPSSGNMPCGTVMRGFGGDIHNTARLAVAMARGLRDGGVLNIPKHYPGANDLPYDSHMREGFISATEEQIIETRLPPYLEMMKAGVIDGIMPGHKLDVKIDPEMPTSLSKKMLDIIRKQGFDGFYLSDALAMMGIVLKYGKLEPAAVALGAGDDFPLPWDVPTPAVYENMLDAYKRGVFNEDDVNNAVRRLIEAQKKIIEGSKIPLELDERDLENIRRINEECIYERVEEGLSPSLSREDKHFFALMVEESQKLCLDEENIPGSKDWYKPVNIAKKIMELFPNSIVKTVTEYPHHDNTRLILEGQTEYDDVVFITFQKSLAYTGREYLSHRIVDLMDALQSTDRIVAHLHIGNPYVGACAPYTPRYINAYCSEKSIEYALEILAGLREAKGKLPYDGIKFYEKGHVFY